MDADTQNIERRLRATGDTSELVHVLSERIRRQESVNALLPLVLDHKKDVAVYKTMCNAGLLDFREYSGTFIHSASIRERIRETGMFEHGRVLPTVAMVSFYLNMQQLSRYGGSGSTAVRLGERVYFSNATLEGGEDELEKKCAAQEVLSISWEEMRSVHFRFNRETQAAARQITRKIQEYLFGSLIHTGPHGGVVALFESPDARSGRVHFLQTGLAFGLSNCDDDFYGITPWTYKMLSP